MMTMSRLPVAASKISVGCNSAQKLGQCSDYDGSFRERV